MNLFKQIFWYVTKPTQFSEVVDICFECDINSIVLQAHGGLQPDQIVGMYDNEKDAIRQAKWLIQRSAVDNND